MSFTTAATLRAALLGLLEKSPELVPVVYELYTNSCYGALTKYMVDEHIRSHHTREARCAACRPQPRDEDVLYTSDKH